MMHSTIAVTVVKTLLTPLRVHCFKSFTGLRSGSLNSEPCLKGIQRGDSRLLGILQMKHWSGDGESLPLKQTNKQKLFQSLIVLGSQGSKGINTSIVWSMLLLGFVFLYYFPGLRKKMEFDIVLFWVKIHRLKVNPQFAQ